MCGLAQAPTLVGVSTGSHARPPAGPGETPDDPREGARARLLRVLRRARAEHAAHHEGARSGDRGGGRGRRTLSSWRVGTPLMVLLSGSLFAVSAVNSEGTDLRAGRYTDLASLVQAEAEAYEELRARVEDLTGQVNDLSAQVGSRDVKRVQERVETLRDPSGLTPREGEGLRIVLSDSPLQAEDTTQPLKFLIVHQQDIQAVVNAMWRGGASAVTVQGQRIVSTTGIKCEANSVTLQGVPYPQPYVIEAVGDPDVLAASVEGDPYLSFYRQQSLTEDIRIGWDMASEEQVEAPAYDGLLDLSYAEPLA